MIIFLTPLELYQPHLIYILSIEVSIKVSSISQNQTRAFTRPNPNMPSRTEDLHPSPYLDSLHDTSAKPSTFTREELLEELEKVKDVRVGQKRKRS
jgi:hypothetical protein